MEINSRAYLRVNLEAIKSNILNIGKHIGENAKIMLVIKADAYGLGAVRVARHLEGIVDYFAVATLEEAIELRAAGIRGRILILGYTGSEDYPLLLEYGIEQTVFSLRDAMLLNESSSKQFKKAKIHIAFDTGMGRIGFRSTECDKAAVKKILGFDNLCTVGAFTHFAAADAVRYDDFTKSQIDNFYLLCNEFFGNGTRVLRHSHNSAGTIRFFNEGDMVRLGIAAYGVNPTEDSLMSGTFELLPTFELKSFVISIKNLPRDAPVGYGLTYKTDKQTKIATVSIGYADGYPRSLSNIGRALIKGRFYKVAGRVCMDMLMLDITSDRENKIRVGDEVTFIGSDGEEYISVDEVARLSGRISYEIMCGISKRVKRIYI